MTDVFAIADGRGAAECQRRAKQAYDAANAQHLSGHDDADLHGDAFQWGTVLQYLDSTGRNDFDRDAFRKWDTALFRPMIQFGRLLWLMAAVRDGKPVPYYQPRKLRAAEWPW